MNGPLSSIPWKTPALWQEANNSLRRSVSRHRRRLAEPIRLANRLRRRLQSIFPLMDELCLQTCPACPDVCCGHAWVWADLKDLLFFHLADIPVPDRQLLSRRGEHCRYAGSRGCRMDRLQRPFVCAWYLCPAQIRLLREHPANHARLTATLQQIKIERRLMEDLFIRAVFK